MVKSLTYLTGLMLSFVAGIQLIPPAISANDDLLMTIGIVGLFIWIGIMFLFVKGLYDAVLKFLQSGSGSPTS
jgi:hypothetical protein